MNTVTHIKVSNISFYKVLNTALRAVSKSSDGPTLHNTDNGANDIYVEQQIPITSYQTHNKNETSDIPFRELNQIQVCLRAMASPSSVTLF